MNCYIYVHDDDKELESSLLERGFTLIDTMQVLKSNSNEIEYDDCNIHVNKIDIDSIPIWIDVFCKSFDIWNWKSEVEKVVKLHFKELILLISYIDNNNKTRIPAGCTALLNRYDLMGLYCLGTVSSFRGQGLAKKVIKISLEIAREDGIDFLFLQTFTNEGFIHFYKKIGFQVLYKKRIFALYK